MISLSLSSFDRSSTDNRLRSQSHPSSLGKLQAHALQGKLQAHALRTLTPRPLGLASSQSSTNGHCDKTYRVHATGPSQTTC